MSLLQISLADLTPYDNNSRTHSDAQVAQIANSIKAFGFTNPILIDEQRGVIAGHGRLRAAASLGMETVPCLTLAGLTVDEKKAYVIADNPLALNAGWDMSRLKSEVQALLDTDFDVDLIGFDTRFLDDLLAEPLPPLANDPDAVPETPQTPISVEGDVWVLGNHRAMCGDSTSVDAVERLMRGERAALLHADPPYGMGKQKDGVQNDNLYREKLDAFQMEWWATYRTFLTDTAAAYIWGNAPDLWRLWYKGGLGDSETLTLRNEIVWDKKSIPGMASDLMTQYPEATERCLYFQFGEQFLGNVNADQYWDGWDKLRLYLAAEADAAQLTPARCREITGVQMYSHWFSKSQWACITEQYYAKLQGALPGRFLLPYVELRRIYEGIKGGYRNHVNGIQGGMRAYFDNAHSVMRDVWDFSRVVGDERHGHATPKPVEMMERVMRTSLPGGGLCVEPFGGTGSTLIAAEKTGRRCYTMELTPAYVDVIVRRWQAATGQQAIHESTGARFDDS